MIILRSGILDVYLERFISEYNNVNNTYQHQRVIIRLGIDEATLNHITINITVSITHTHTKDDVGIA